MTRDYRQVAWDSALEDDLRQLIRLAVREDLERAQDWTTVALAPAGVRSQAGVVARQQGVAAGLQAAEIIFHEMDIDARVERIVEDGQRLQPGQTLLEIDAPTRDLLTAERTLLNFLGRLCGVATNTEAYVARITGCAARLYDTRKTTPGWRRLEKYAVRCGGGVNHRTGLYDAILIKDNHLAFAQSTARTPADAVAASRDFLSQYPGGLPEMVIEVEVDTLEQLQQVLPQSPDVVLLDNMPPEQLRQAIGLRDQLAPGVALEASGGITLETIRSIAETGVDRISVGALTHSAINYDVGLDWRTPVE
ncbi:carboxylating nicotinate-nucleotide diphosphorylase [Lignipirellula cremea]|uniref:Probable nicotinate-nucleotide pyrophosphorylase [carboxylating] n=1 Tax=Lignipirellula cremea TaxID=2528010 RepID=A0A518DUL5_9BACT|nr:carboxylating nicotinate-nucleotide diphosphorylase [Lignipirellula cremea]QDU95531.1 Nicotinate-nucleotide pyrophosphorylase [carboxylating] [Lignipirellula cremea]